MNSETTGAFGDSGNSPPSVKKQEKFKLHTIEDLRKLPPAEWLIDNIIGLNTFAVLYGQPGEAKSFVALDMALSVASGRDWHTHPVKKRGVVYVVAEGGRAIAPRIAAWLKRAAISGVNGAFFLLEAPQLHKPNDLKPLLTSLTAVNDLGLVIIDTLARAFVGGDENSAQEMGAWIDSVRRIQATTGATVLAVHHAGKPGDSGPKLERGSSSLRGAADTMVRVALDRARNITLQCTKQKDAEPFESITLKLACFSLDNSPAAMTSCVPADAGSASSSGGRTLNPGQQATLAALRSLGAMATSKSWRDAAGLSDSTFHRHRRFLLENGYVHPVDGKRSRYQLTKAGTATATSLPLVATGSGPTDTATTATPL
jgi:hypothetical protein